jgi:hypothetical protein
MPLRLLPHLEAIRATPRDQRSFAAFARRPDMIAAGAGKDMIDDFDFDDEPALDGVIGDLRLAVDRRDWGSPATAEHAVGAAEGGGDACGRQSSRVPVFRGHGRWRGEPAR